MSRGVVILQRFANLVWNEISAADEEKNSAHGADERLAELLARNNPSVIEAISNACSTFRDTRRRLLATPHSWMNDALRDALGGNPFLWQELLAKNGKKIARLTAYTENKDEGRWLVSEGSPSYSPHGIRMTFEEYLKIIEESENRYEYIDGEIFLDVTLFHLENEEKVNVAQPDILVICDPEKIDEKGKYRGTPTLVVEVLSDSTRSRDMVKKLDLYMESGIKEYWVINTSAAEIYIYVFAYNTIETIISCKGDGLAESVVFPGLNVALKQAFSTRRGFIA